MNTALAFDTFSDIILPNFVHFNLTLMKLEAQGPCTGHRSTIAILYCFSFKYMKREKGRDLTQYTNLCGLNTLPH